ncbi:MAG: hypothetical protein U0793_03290 [Gemmataceae bacterium]
MSRTSIAASLLGGGLVLFLLYRGCGSKLDPRSGFPLKDADEWHEALDAGGPWIVRRGQPTAEHEVICKNGVRLCAITVLRYCEHPWHVEYTPAPRWTLDRLPLVASFDGGRLTLWSAATGDQVWQGAHHIND